MISTLTITRPHDGHKRANILNGLKSLSHIATIVLIILVFNRLNQINCLHERHEKSHKEGQCPQQWTQHGQKCYKSFLTLKNFAGAKTRCADLLAELPYIEDDSTRDGELAGSSWSDQNISVVNYLKDANRPELLDRVYHVNVSPDLQRQAKLLMQIENSSMNYETHERIDIDSMSDLWLNQDDPVISQSRLNVSDYRADMNLAFGLGYSAIHKRWGLVPVSPTKRLAHICEKPINSSYTRKQHPIAHSIPNLNHHHHHQHQQQHQNQFQDVEPNRARDLMAQASNTIPNHQQPAVGSNPQADNKKHLEKEPPSSPSPTQTQQAASAGSVPQPEPPSSALFRDQPQNQSIVLGSTSEMRCSPLDADSNLSWTFNGRNLSPSNRVRLYPNGTLKIEHVRNSDGGNYSCVIQSGGMAETKTARLEIIERPHQPEYITAELLDKLSTSVRLKWTPGFNGNSPIIKYLIEMRTVDGDNIDNEMNSIMQSSNWEIAKANISADQTSVIIPDLKPARKYIFRIKATNRVGTGDPSLPTRNPIEVPVQPPSMAPENLSGSPRSSNSISVQWSPPPKDSQNGLIKGYKIRHKLAGYASDADWYTNEVPEVARLNFVLEDLISWQNYEIQIAAENDKGVGPYSSSVFVRTKEGRPDKGPRSVSAEAVGPNVIKINWNPPPPQHINGLNQGYRVQVWLNESLTQLAKETVVQHNSLTPLQTATIDGLLPYTDYYVSVKCFTNAGDGVANEELVSVRTKQDLPEAVPVIEFFNVLDETLRVVWRAPKRINGELSHYTVEYSETSSSDKKILKKYPATITEARIAGLSPETSYTFKIYAHTDVGPGPGKTAQITTSVPPVRPEPPSKLVPLNIGPYSVTVQFEPGFDGNAGIDRWLAEALTPSHGDYKPRWQNIYNSTNHTQGSNQVTIHNLRPFTRYKIRLTPVNIVGHSLYPSESTGEFQTSQIEPEQAPKELSIEDVHSNSVMCRWSPLNNNLWLGHPRGYNLTWMETNNATIMSHLINETLANSYLVRDLEEYTEYTFRIYAVNDIGSSPASEPVTIVTLEDAPSSGPSNVTAHAVSSNTISVDWNTIPKRHRNGILRGYRIQYQAFNTDAPLQHKTIEDNNTRHVTLNDLKPFTLYRLAVAAFTSAGDGVYSPVVRVQTLEDTPGKPQNLSNPTVSLTSARILWDPPENPNGDVIGYKVSYHLYPDSGKEIASHELHQNERTFKATNLKPDTHYVFTVSARTREGWGQQASTIVYTYDSELRANLPFHKESWFVILCACSSVLITIIVTALLFIQTKTYKYKQDAIKSTSQDRLGDAGFSIDDEPPNHYNNGFGLLPSGANHRRSNGALSQSTANFTLPKTPPRPHPGSVAYSDDDDGDDDVFEDVAEKPVKSIAGTSHYDSSGDSLTEKPSEISSSPAPESESADDEYVNMRNKHFVSHYANVNGTLRSQRSWKKVAPAKQYTSHRTKPKLPQRPAPSVPQVPNDHSLSSSDNASNQPIAGTSGMQRTDNNSNRFYGEPSGSSMNHHQQQQQQQQQTTNRTIPSNSSPQVNGYSEQSSNQNNNPNIDQNTHRQQEQQQQAELLNNHIVSLNGGRIIVDNMAGSRAPLPGFTSFV